MSALRLLLQPQDGEEGSHPAATSELDKLMRKVFEKPAADPVQAHKPAQTQRDFNTASDLLERAVAAFDVLVSRCQQLETQMTEAAERAKSEAAAQERVIDEWKKAALEMKSRAEDNEKRLGAMKMRSDAAEALAETAEARSAALREASEASARQAARAENLLTELHDKVVAAFGISSRAPFALEAVTRQTAFDHRTSAA